MIKGHVFGSDCISCCSALNISPRRRKKQQHYFPLHFVTEYCIQRVKK
jgi:hypothetical protein